MDNTENKTNGFTAQALADTCGTDYSKANGFIKFCEALGVLESNGTETLPTNRRGKRARTFEINAELLERLSEKLLELTADGPPVVVAQPTVTVGDNTDTVLVPESDDTASDADFSFEADFSDEPTVVNVPVPTA